MARVGNENGMGVPGNTAIGEVSLAGTQTLTNKTLTLPAISQIQFPADQVASAGANVLDDYEEGTITWAVTFGGAAVSVTYGDQAGRYTKIGDTVRVSGNMRLTSKGSSVGAMLITGLPFAHAATAPGSVSLDFHQLAAAIVTAITGQLGTSSTTITPNKIIQKL